MWSLVPKYRKGFNGSVADTFRVGFHVARFHADTFITASLFILQRGAMRAVHLLMKKMFSIRAGSLRLLRGR